MVVKVVVLVVVVAVEVVVVLVVVVSLVGSVLVLVVVKVVVVVSLVGSVLALVVVKAILVVVVMVVVAVDVHLLLPARFDELNREDCEGVKKLEISISFVIVTITVKMGSFVRSAGHLSQSEYA